jgi:parallel beta-helix repeat protein
MGKIMKKLDFKTVVLSLIVFLAIISAVSAEMGTPITTVCEINESGTYYLNNSITYGSGTVINITCDDVVLNGNGYVIGGSSIEEYVGINATGVTNITIANATITGFGCGIQLINTTDSRIENNTANDNTWGIYLGGSSNNTLTSNNATGNLYDGIFLKVSSYNTITSNTLNDNSDGIYLMGSSNNTITSNNATGNE